MAEYVTDTHGLLWYFTHPHRLGPHALAAFAEVHAGQANLLVPVIVLAELIFAIEGGHVHTEFDPLLRALQAIPNVNIIDLTLARTLDLRTLTAIPEMHDRLIVAEAIARGLPLITRDQTITASGLVKTVW
jgi:PIN domain nuclease of toxin-antitoxin system